LLVTLGGRRMHAWICANAIYGTVENADEQTVRPVTAGGCNPNPLYHTRAMIDSRTSKRATKNAVSTPRPCSYCGLETHPDFASHCCGCGHKLPKESAIHHQLMCTRCGTDQEDGNYCCQCGWPLPLDPVPRPASPDATAESFRELSVDPLGGFQTPTVCPGCQSFLHPQNATHCCLCGHQLPDTLEEVFHDACLACGEEGSLATHKFCHSCGWPLDKVRAPKRAPRIVPSSPSQEHGAHIYIPTSPSSSTPRRPATPRPAIFSPRSGQPQPPQQPPELEALSHVSTASSIELRRQQMRRRGGTDNERPAWTISGQQWQWPIDYEATIARPAALVIGAAESGGVPDIQHTVMIYKSHQRSVANALASRAHRAAKIAFPARSSLPPRSAYRPAIQDLPKKLCAVNTTVKEAGKEAWSREVANAGKAKGSGGSAKKGGSNTKSAPHEAVMKVLEAEIYGEKGAWRANMLESPAVKAMLQRMASESLRERPISPLSAPRKVGEPRPSVLVVVEMNYHPGGGVSGALGGSPRLGGSARLRGTGLSLGHSLSHDPEMYERTYRRLADAIGEAIVSPLAKWEGALSFSSATTQRPSRYIPAKVVRAVAVEEEIFDSRRLSSYPHAPHGFMPTNVSFTGPSAAKTTARANRLGAFEVYLIVNHVPASGASSAGAGLDFRSAVAGLHSKLYSREFPRVSTIIRRCQQLLLPIFHALQESEDALEAARVAEGRGGGAARDGAPWTVAPVPMQEYVDQFRLLTSARPRPMSRSSSPHARQGVRIAPQTSTREVAPARWADQTPTPSPEPLRADQTPSPSPEPLRTTVVRGGRSPNPSREPVGRRGGGEGGGGGGEGGGGGGEGGGGGTQG